MGDREVQCFYACPECGALMPYLQKRCDCGFRFRRRWPKDRRLVVAVVVLSVALALAVGVIWYQQETLPGKYAGAGYVAERMEEDPPRSESFAEWSERNHSAVEGVAPISTAPPLATPPTLPSLVLPSLRGE